MLDVRGASWVLGNGHNLAGANNTNVDLQIGMPGMGAKKHDIFKRHCRIYHNEHGALFIEGFRGSPWIKIGSHVLEGGEVRAIQGPRVTLELGNAIFDLEFIMPEPAYSNRVKALFRSLSRPEPSSFLACATTSADFLLGDWAIKGEMASGVNAEIQAALNINTGESGAVKEFVVANREIQRIIDERQMLKNIPEHV